MASLPEYLSPSSISTFEQCPLKYKYTRIDKMPEPPTRATLMGNFVHEVLENFYALPPDERTVVSVKNLSRVVWDESGWFESVLPILLEEPSVKSGKSSQEQEMNMFRWQSWWCIENIFSLENPKAITPAGIEHELNGLVDGVPIKGFIDRWSVDDGSILISDYKTGKTPRAQYMQDKYTQLYIYAVVLSEEKQMPVKRVELLYLKDGHRMTSSPTSQQLDETVVRIRSTWDAVCSRLESDSWETIPSRLCDWCSFKNTICPYWNKTK